MTPHAFWKQFPWKNMLKSENQQNHLIFIDFPTYNAQKNSKIEQISKIASTKRCQILLGSSGSNIFTNALRFT